MNNSHFYSIPQDEAPEILNVVIEIKEGDFNKYEYNKDLGILELDRVLHGPTFFPFNYGDVPGTWNEGDNDPLDVVMISTGSIVPGSLVKGRVIGLLEMDDNGEQDNKVVCVNDRDPRYDHVKTVDDLTEGQRKDVKGFFSMYKIPQTGRDSVKVGDFLKPEKAHELINECLEAFKKKFADKDN